MGRAYYGVPGVNPGIEEEEDYYYEYEKLDETEIPEPPYAQAAILFLVGLPFLPIWSAVSILISLFKIAFYSSSDPERAAVWNSHLRWYIIFFVVGLIFYSFFIPWFFDFFDIYI